MYNCTPIIFSAAQKAREKWKSCYFLPALLLLLGFLSLCCQPLAAQKGHTDSLLLILQNQQGVLKVKTLHALSSAYTPFAADKALEYAHQALMLAKSLEDRSAQTESAYQLGAAYAAAQQPEQALAYLQQGLTLAQAAESTALIGQGYLALARYYQQLNDLRKSNEYLAQCLATSVNPADKGRRADCYSLLGANYHALGLYDKALAEYLKALEVHEQQQDKAAIARDFNSIGRVYMYTKDFEQAVTYFTKSLQLHEARQDSVGRMKCILNLGVIFQKQGSYDSALLYFRRALPMARQLGQKVDEALLTGNIGSTLMQQGKLQEGLAMMEQALALKEANRSYRSILHTLNDMADVKIQLGDAAGAKATAEKVIRLARKYEEGNQLRHGYLNLSRSYKLLKDFERAHAYLEKYDAIKDSLFGIDKARQINTLHIQYETEKKDQAIASLQREKELEDLKTRAYLLAGGVLLLAGVVLYNSQRLKTKKHQQLLAKEKEVDRLKTNFFANISHEFRTPLTLILGPLDTLLAEIKDPQQRQQLGFMKESAGRLLRLINQILDLAKIESGHLLIKPRKVSVLPILKGVTGSFSSLADARNISLSFQTELNNPKLYCDPAQLETILINLLSNAFKFSESGGEVSVRVGALSAEYDAYPEGALEIKVSDTGAGISAEQVAHIFDRFYQAGHAKASFFGGTGIGLALTKELVQLHGGTIAVQSEAGKGTTVCVQLPFGKAHFSKDQLLEVAHSEEEQLLHSMEDSGQKKLVLPGEQEKTGKQLPMLLLIEDNEDVRAYIRTILQAAYNIIEAPNGEEGVKQAFEHIPDLIISDVMMPKMNGYEVSRQLKQDERTSHIPLILLTAKASVHSRIEGLETEADLYLCKPFVPRELRLSIQNLLQSRQRLRERYQKQLVLKPSELAVNSVDEQFLARLMKVLETNYADENFTVDHLSKEVGMSRSQLHRKLEALTNESTSQFIRSFRLQRAMELLKKKHASISEIAYMVGFGSPSYFNRCFLKQYGQTPSAVMGDEAG